MRLIDADELMEHVWRDRLDSRELIAEMINNTPTVKVISTNIPISIFERLNSQEPCEDCISRTEVKRIVDFYKEQIDGVYRINESVDNLPSVTPKPKTGHWIYDKNIENWRCSECGETPKTLGYCGTADFMAEHFKYCNHCGIRMVGQQAESEEDENDKDN